MKTLFVPGGVLLLAAVVLVGSGWVSVAPATADFYFYAACVATLLLGLRFRCSRALFALITILLAQRAVAFFSAGHVPVAGAGRIAFQALALLVPVNFLVIGVAQEQGLSWTAALPRLITLFLESVFVAIICRPGATQAPTLLRMNFLDHQWFHWTHIPQLAIFAFAAVITTLIVRALLYRRAVEIGLLWSCAAVLAACQANAVGRIANMYWGTAAFILTVAIVENSYALAYRDELTSLPSRRAFNEDMLGWQKPYVIAAVDIDHFKSFNDTYGHDTGDEVLRMVASRLAQVTGGGKAFRIGGEEFSIVFPGKQAKDVLTHLELLRTTVEQSVFRIRKGEERRQAARGPDRRTAAGKKSLRTVGVRQRDQVSVTVSIGVAEATRGLHTPEQVIAAADKALYRAKRGGRNRVEAMSAGTRPRLKHSIA